jgi:hypothetical protein
MRLAIVAALAGISSAAAPAYAGVNLLTNGSFEQGTGSAGEAGTFTGWTIGGTSNGSGPGAGPQRIQYGTNATGYGDNVSPDPFTNSPDASGSNAAFFVDDAANETLSQHIGVTAGTTYEVGFDFFETLTGAANPNPFTLSAMIDGTVLTTVTSGVNYGAGTWYHVFETFTPLISNSGSLFTFVYNSGPSAAKDVIVDDVYVEVAPPGDIPEPASALVLGAGLFGLMAMRRRA